MPSPLLRYANAILFFEVSDGITQFDEDGNPFLQTTETPVQAYLVPSKSKGDGKTEQLPGGDVGAIYLTGFLVSPKAFPESIYPPIRVRCMIDGRNGELEIKPSINHPIAISSRIVGRSIQGFWRVAGNS